MSVQIRGYDQHSLRLCRPDLRKASGFPAQLKPLVSSSPPARLSLPGGAEEVMGDARRRKGAAFPQVRAAEPQVILTGSERNLEKLAPWRART